MIVKKIYVFFLCFLMLFFGCDQNKTAGLNNNINVGTENYIEESSYYFGQVTEENLISIHIPFYSDLDEREKELIKNNIFIELFEFCDEEFNLAFSNTDFLEKNDEYTNYYIEIEAEISYKAYDLVSIVFRGFLNQKQAAHPVNLLFTFNYDPSTLHIVDFCRKHAINDELYNIFSKIAKKDIIEQCDGEWPDGWGDFSEEICSKEQFFKGMKVDGEIRYYYKDNGIVLGFPVPFSLGDYIEVEIPYDLIPQN